MAHDESPALSPAAALYDTVTAAHSRISSKLPRHQRRVPLADALLACCTESERTERGAPNSAIVAQPTAIGDAVPDVLAGRLPALDATLAAHAVVLCPGRAPLEVDLGSLARALGVEPRALIWLIEAAGADVGFDPFDSSGACLQHLGCEDALRLLNGSSDRQARGQVAIHVLSAGDLDWRIACDHAGTLTATAIDALADALEHDEAWGFRRFTQLPDALMLDSDTARRWAERALGLLPIDDEAPAYLWDEALEELRDLPAWARSDGPVRALFAAVLERALVEPFDPERDLWTALAAATGIVTGAVDPSDRERSLAEQLAQACLAHSARANTFVDVRSTLLELLAFDVDTRAALRALRADETGQRRPDKADRCRALQRARLASVRAEQWVQYAEEAQDEAQDDGC